MKVKIVGTESGDWHVLYVDGKLACQNHSIKPRDICEALNIKCEYAEVSDEWAEQNQFPEDLEDLKCL